MFVNYVINYNVQEKLFFKGRRRKGKNKKTLTKSEKKKSNSETRRRPKKTCKIKNKISKEY